MGVELGVKRRRRSYAPQTPELPIPDVVWMKITSWIWTKSCKCCCDCAICNLQRFLPLCFVLCSVNPSWRSLADELCGQFLGEDFRQAARSIAPTLTSLRAARELKEWRDQRVTTTLHPAFVAGLAAQKLGAYWANRFSFRRAHRVVLFKEQPTRGSWSDDAFDQQMEDYFEDDGPIMTRGSEIQGYGKITHEISAGLSRDGKLIELDASLFYEVEERHVVDHSKGTITCGRKTWLSWEKSDHAEVKERHSDPDVAKSVSAVMERDLIEDAVSDLLSVLRNVFHGVDRPCYYAPGWSWHLSEQIKKTHEADDCSSEDE